MLLLLRGAKVGDNYHLFSKWRECGLFHAHCSTFVVELTAENLRACYDTVMHQPRWSFGIASTLLNAFHKQQMVDHTVVAPHEANRTTAISLGLIHLLWPSFHPSRGKVQANDNDEDQLDSTMSTLAARYSITEFNLLCELLYCGSMVWWGKGRGS